MQTPNRNRGNQNELNRFDNMSSSEDQNSNVFRPQTVVKNEVGFKPDEKPVAEAKPKKPFPIKPVLCVVGIVVVLILVINLVPGLSRSFSAIFKGNDNLYWESEKQRIEYDISKVVSLVNKFPKLTTDGAIKGEFDFNLEYPEEFGAPYLGGTYSGDYAFETKANMDRIKLTYAKEGQEMGTTTITNSYKDGVVIFTPSFAYSGIELPLSIYTDLEKLDLPVTSEIGEKFIENYGGIQINRLCSLLNNKEDALSLVQPYMELVKKIPFETEMVGNKYINTVSWGDLKPVYDEFMQLAKTDKSMLTFVTACGIREQAYMDTLVEIDGAVTSWISAAGEDAEIVYEAIANQDGVITERHISIPTNETDFFNYTDKSTSDEILLSFDNKTYSVLKEDGYCIITIDDVIITFEPGYEIGDLMKGTCQIELPSGKTVTLIFDSNMVNMTIEQEQKTLATAKFDYQTYTVMDLVKEKSAVSLTSWNERDIENYLLGCNLTNVNNYIEKISGDTQTLDSGSFVEGLYATFAGIATREYGVSFFDTNYATDKIDISAVLREAVDDANFNATAIAKSIMSFIKECETYGTEPITDGVFAGFADSEKADMFYGVEFNASNIQNCIGCSVPTGYYCFVIKDARVAYAFWSENIDFQTYINARELPSHFEDITGTDNVRGSYPIPSTIGGEGNE